MCVVTRHLAAQAWCIRASRWLAWFGTISLLASGAGAAGAAAAAQQPLHVSPAAVDSSARPGARSPERSAPADRMMLRVDNDAFDFWLPAWGRPDQEYTSGVELTLERHTPPWWARRFVHRTGACGPIARDCIVGSESIGQDMYTPERHIGDAGPPPGSRPNAGWLYYESAVRVVSNGSYRGLAITLGATGPPSLARETQEFFHSLAPSLNRPSDWNTQVPFEPGVNVRGDWARRAGVGLHDELPASLGIELQPRASISLGDVLTDAEVGARVRAGMGLGNPWLAPRRRFRVALTAGAALHAVAHNVFLDGPLFRRSPHVARRPLVSETELGAEISFWRFTFGYRAVTTGPEYWTHHAPHTWASMTGAVY